MPLNKQTKQNKRYFFSGEESENMTLGLRFQISSTITIIKPEWNNMVLKNWKNVVPEWLQEKIFATKAFIA